MSKAHFVIEETYSIELPIVINLFVTGILLIYLSLKFTCLRLLAPFR